MKKNSRYLRKELVMVNTQTQSPGRAPSETPREAHSQSGHGERGRQRE